MIMGNEPIADWDKAVKEFLDKGGQAAIDEVNQLLTKSKITGEWREGEVATSTNQQHSPAPPPHSL
jgi:hypothetical protein